MATKTSEAEPHVRHVVQCGPHGFLSGRRTHNYKQVRDIVPFEQARLYARRGDAQKMCEGEGEGSDTVRDVYIQLLP